MTVRSPAEEARRRARLAALGDVSTDRASDDADEGWAGSADAAEASRDDALRREVPPHHE